MQKAADPSSGRAKSYPPGSFLGKLRARGILNTLAAFVGSGWLAYEIVHFILVEHYGLPGRLKDITIVTVLAAMLCTLSWRWFRGEPRTKGPRWERILIPAFILAGGAADVSYLFHLDDPGRHSENGFSAESGWKNSVAVLPFLNISADQSQDYFCDGLTEEMINRLSQIPGLRVTARTSVFVFKGENWDIRDVGRRLGVEHVLEGSVRKDGSQLRVTAQLIKAADGFHLWSENYDREMDKIFGIQDDIALSVAKALRLTLLGDRRRAAQTQSLEAYDEYLLGQSLYRNPTKENAAGAVARFRRAVTLDPDYADAWASLAATQALQAGFGYVPVEEGFPAAIASLERALALDERQAFAYAVQGWIRMSYNWDWAGAEASYAKALNLEPAKGMFGGAQLALGLGRFDQAIALARRAAELDSLSATTHMNLALALFYAGRLEEAAESFATVLRLNPERSNAHALLAQVYLWQSRPDKALTTVEKEHDVFLRLPTLGMVYHALGRTGESYDALAKFIEDYREGNAYQIAQVFAYLGDFSQAFEWLEIAYGSRDGGLFLVKADPFFRTLHDDPRFAALLEKMKFPAGTP